MIIFFGILFLINIGFIIGSIIAMKKGNLEILPGVILCVLVSFLAFVNFMATRQEYLKKDDIDNGTYPNLVTEYDMTYEYDIHDKSEGIYRKNNLEFKLYHNEYTITDRKEYSYDYHEIILVYFVNINEKTIKKIYDNLKENSDFMEREISMTLRYKEYEIIVSLDSRNEKMTYKISKIYNNNINKLIIMHNNDNYYESDKELVKELFNENLDFYDAEKKDNVIEYTLTKKRW